MTQPPEGTPAHPRYPYRGVVAGSAEGVSLDEIVSVLCSMVGAQGDRIDSLRHEVHMLRSRLDRLQDLP